MHFSSSYEDRLEEITDMFISAFSESEGVSEDALIGTLAKNLISTTPIEDLYVFLANNETDLFGCIVFTRLKFECDVRDVFLLSPVAILPSHQRKGLGCGLLRYGLDVLKQDGVDIAITYGDPNYYKRVGFKLVAAELVPPPLPLNQPEGWLAQSLTKAELRPLEGPSRCAEALSDPNYW